MELRRVLFKKPKKELIELIGKFSRECPHFTSNRDVYSLNQEVLASKLWGILLNLRLTYPNEDYSICLDILSKKKKEKKEKASEKIDIYLKKPQEHVSEYKIKIIPFLPDEICKNLHVLISKNQNLMEKWKNERKYQGFISFLATNEICIPSALEKMLYDKLFYVDGEFMVEDALLIDYARYQLDKWEENLKAFISVLTNEEIDMIFSLHLLYRWIVNILEERNEKISYTYNDIPLLKRVLLAQYLKLINNDKCTDDELDNLAEVINDIVYYRIDNLSIKVLPWGDLD